MTRLTGLNSGLDVDALVKASMTTYQSKIDKESQNKKVLEYQQEQYKKIITDSANFYDKYFDILKTGNLMSTNSYQSVSFKSGDDTKVIAKGFAGAVVSDYKVTVTQLASKATASFDENSLNVTNKKMYVRVGTKEVSVDIANTGDYEKDMKTTVNNLNTELNKEGIDVSVKYSEFSKGIVLESGTMGKSTIFEAGVGSSETYTEYKGTDAKGTITKGTETYPIDQASNVVNVDNVQFTLKGVTSGTASSSKYITSSSISSLLQDDIKQVADTSSKVYTLTDGSKIEIKNDGTLTITKKDGTTPIDDTDYIKFTKADKTTVGLKGDGTIVNLKDDETIDETISGIGITSLTISSLLQDDIKQVADTSSKIYTLTDGSKIEIKNDGTLTITKKDGTKPIGGTEHIDFVKADGTRATLNADGTLVTAANETGVLLSGSTDVNALKDKIISFVNDYNTLLSSINTKIYETRDKDYMPLSDEQKKEMTDDQIEKWETKAQTGLIRKDMDLERITSAMKSAMSTVMSGSGLHLESIGINPIANYAEKNGMFTIDEDKLTKALEENAENIKDLFTREASSKDKSDKGGIFTQLAETLKSEFKLSTSSLSKKAGIDGTSTQYSNTLTKSIAKKKTLIEELNDKFSLKETALYKKYSALETALEKLNSQQASLSSMLGTS